MLRAASPPATDERQALRRRLLRADGVVVAVAGLAVALFAGPLHGLMGWPGAGALTAVGLLLLAWGALLAGVATMRSVGRGPTLAVALLNSLWFDASLVVAAVGPAGLTGTGRILLLLGGLVAIGFAVAQVLTVRQR